MKRAAAVLTALALSGSLAACGGEGDEGDAEDRPAGGGGTGRVLLFNLADDPNEKVDLASKRPDKVAELRAAYETFAAQAVPPRAAPKPPGFRSPRIWGQAD